MADEKETVEVTTEQQFDTYAIMYTESDIDKILNQALKTPVKG